mgnify:CR=1 FL=1
MTVTPLNKQNTSRIAQSFYVDRENGMYVTDIDLFFAAKPPSSGEPVYVTIRNLESGVPSSITFLAKAERKYGTINTSVDGTTATKFTFAHPVYLNGFTSYAFTVETNSSEYQVYYSEIYDYVLNSTEKLVDKNPVTGSLFLSQSGVTWNAVQERDLKFRIYKANWSAYTNAEVLVPIKLQNKAIPMKMLWVDPIQTDGTTTFFVQCANHGFQEGDKVKLTGVVGTGGGNYVGGIHIDNINFATAGALQIKSGSAIPIGAAGSRDWTGFKVTAASVQANIALTWVKGGGSAIKTEQNYLYTDMVPTIDALSPQNTQVSYGVKATAAGKNPWNNSSGTYVRDDAYTQIWVNKTSKFNDRPRLIGNNTSEAENPSVEIANNKTFEIVAHVSSKDPANVMPIVDLQRANVAVMAPVIDNQSTSTNTDGFNIPINYQAETNPTGGSAAAKHITTIFPLEASAVGLKVMIGAHRPSVATIELYYRTGLDGEVLGEKNWILQATENNPPSDEDTSLFREYEYLIGGTAGIDPFEQFQFKIVMKSQNMLKPPLIKDFRAIALGT